jgi:hypothetical protein
VRRDQVWVANAIIGFGIFLIGLGAYATALHLVWHIHPEATRDSLGTMGVGAILVGGGVFLRRR